MGPVLHCFGYSLDYLREQVAPVPSAEMVAQTLGIANHPAWTIGHLTLICQMLCGTLGTEPWLDDDWIRRYGTGSTPLPNAGLYEPKDRALVLLRDAQARMTSAVESLDDARLDQPFPDPALLDVFPTIRHAVTQVLVGHTSSHVGQITIWRRAMGYPPMARSFE